jgi:transcriptional regulator GlxA family with amidase domain
MEGKLHITSDDGETISAQAAPAVQPISHVDYRVVAAIAIMRRSFASPCSISFLARSLNLSPTRLRELFQKQTGRSPRDYLRRLRIQRAEDLLRLTFLSVKEIAAHTGATDVSHFVRAFKRHSGLTPSEYRRSFSSLRE